MPLNIHTKKPSSKHPYNIDIESLLDLPANVYWKNRDGFYLGCNDKIFEFGFANNEQDFISTTLQDYSHILDVEYFEMIDNQVMSSNKSLCLIEQGVSDKSPQFLTTKFPLLNNHGKVAGLLGISFNLTNPPHIRYDSAIFNKNLLTRQQLENQFKKIYFKRLAASDILLTPREQECVSYLCQGRTLREIANLLKISARTVETHVSRVKQKMGCRTKGQLLDKLVCEW